MHEGAIDMTPMSQAMVNSTPERIKWLVDHGASLYYAVERRAYCTPLENLRAVLDCGYDPNTFDEDSEDTKVIDHLANCYELGIGTPPDKARAIGLYSKSGQLGARLAQQALMRLNARSAAA